VSRRAAPSRGYASTVVASDFASLVSLACHDLRTPLATVHGFAKTLARLEELEPEKVGRYLGLIESASDELVGLLDVLSLAARIENGRYEPVLLDTDSLELARAAAPAATGTGATVQVDRESVERALAALVRAAKRHGGVEPRIVVSGASIALAPVPEAAAPIVLGEEQKDLGAAVAVRLVRALGGEVALEGEQLTVSLPTA
jgi:signal transduction histidine kinase